MGESPSSWRKYVRLHKPHLSDESSQFCARYRLAHTYSGSVFDGLTANTQSAYSELIRAGLIYSVIETYGRLTRGKNWKGHFSVIDKAKAEKLRGPSFSKMHEMLHENLDPGPRRKHESFRDGETDDLVNFYAGLRHLVFHGHATAYGAGLPKSKKAVGVLNETSTWMLTQIDDLFTDYVDGLHQNTSKG